MVHKNSFFRIKIPFCFSAVLVEFVFCLGHFVRVRGGWGYSLEEKG